MAIFIMQPRLSHICSKSTAVLVAAALTGVLTGCGDKQSAGSGIRQTGFPGEVTAGGTTSGEIMHRNTGKVAASMPAGTPGIPQGAEGNVGGAAMGGAAKASGGDSASTTPATGNTATPAATAPAAVPREGRGVTAQDPDTATGTPKPTTADVPKTVRPGEKQGSSGGDKEVSKEGSKSGSKDGGK